MAQVKLKQVNISTHMTYNETSGDINHNGNFSAVTKQFVIDHPTKPGFKLAHGNLEGPEHGIYIRGKSEAKRIFFPEYWASLANKDSITVTITPFGKSQSLWIKAITDTYFEVAGSHKPQFFYLVQAERKDVKPLQIEIDMNK